MSMGLFKRSKSHSEKTSTQNNKPAGVQSSALDAELAAQDEQLDAIHQAEAAFEESNDVDALISFWEEIWNNGGLLFNGSHWTFRLPDLYMKQKRYDDALRILRKIKNPQYQDKKASYIEKINAAKKKADR